MSLTSNDFKKRYNLETYLKVRYPAVTFVSLLDAQTMEDLGKDPQALHKQNLPSLPPGAPTSYTGYEYGKFVNDQGENIFIGLPWINMDATQQLDGTTSTVTIRDASMEQITSLRSMLVGMGITKFTISTQ